LDNFLLSSREWRMRWQKRRNLHKRPRKNTCRQTNCQCTKVAWLRWILSSRLHLLHLIMVIYPKESSTIRWCKPSSGWSIPCCFSQTIPKICKNGVTIKMTTRVIYLNHLVATNQFLLKIKLIAEKWLSKIGFKPEKTRSMKIILKIKSRNLKPWNTKLRCWTKNCSSLMKKSLWLIRRTLNRNSWFKTNVI